jgi:hypothetical protein
MLGLVISARGRPGWKEGFTGKEDVLQMKKKAAKKKKK